MTRYWFKTRLRLGIGVTAHTLEDARRMISERLAIDGFGEIIEIVANVDVRSLDQGHVIPNLGPCSNRGIWYPFIAGSVL